MRLVPNSFPTRLREVHMETLDITGRAMANFSFVLTENAKMLARQNRYANALYNLEKTYELV